MNTFYISELKYLMLVKYIQVFMKEVFKKIN